MRPSRRSAAPWLLAAMLLELGARSATAQEPRTIDGARPVTAEDARTTGPSTSSAAPVVADVRNGSVSEEGVHWRAEWPRFRVGEYVTTGALAATLLTLRLTLPDTGTARWVEKLTVDEGVRQGLRAGSARGRQVAGGVSDLLFLGLALYPLVVDAGLAAGGRHGRWDVAGQMLAINLQSYALTTLVTMLTKYAVRRERPFARRCDGSSNVDGCESTDRNRSFVSGHSAMAFTSAGLICAHNTNLPLYGSERAGRAACFTALGAASIAGAMRVVADKHYLTDVVLGAAIGLLSGYLLPTWLHYGFGERDPKTGLHAHGTVGPLVSPSALGLTYQHAW